MTRTMAWKLLRRQLQHQQLPQPIPTVWATIINIHIIIINNNSTTMVMNPWRQQQQQLQRPASPPPRCP